MCIHLQPLTSANPSRSSTGASSGPAGDELTLRLERRLQAAENELRGLKRKHDGPGRKGDGKKGRGKGDKGGSGRAARDAARKLPAGIPENARRGADDGSRICFSYNLPVGCLGAVPGQSCSKGKHVCISCPTDQAHSHQSHVGR